jgi:hypothetical protein
MPHNNVALFDTRGPLGWAERALSMSGAERRKRHRERQQFGLVGLIISLEQG